MKLTLYMVASSTEALGPFKRFAVWVQGCKKRCPGCISPDAQPLDGGYTIDVKNLANEILATPETEGITISGGEPFLQQDALCELIDLVRAQKDLGVIIYTGMTYSQVQYTELAQKCDLIVDGEYIDELNDDKSLRGSSNQRVICVSDRYTNVVDRLYGCTGRKIELSISNRRVTMVGIPSKSQAQVIFQHDEGV